MPNEHAEIVYDPLPKLEIEPRLLLVAPRPDGKFHRRRGRDAPGYVRLDLITTYKINDNFSAYLRFENLTNANYQEVYNYGTAGRSVYAGLTARF